MKEPIPIRDGWISLRAKESVAMTAESTAEWTQQRNILRQTRGNIIAFSLDIEFAMDTAIRELLFSLDSNVDEKIKQKVEKERSIFDRVVSKSGSLTFNGKIRVLKMLLQETEIVNSPDQKRLFDLLERVRIVRNKFAHTTMAFEPKTVGDKTQLCPYIVEDGKRVYLDEKYFGVLNNLYSECLIRAENVTRAIQKTPLEPTSSPTKGNGANTNA